MANDGIHNRRPAPLPTPPKDGAATLKPHAATADRSTAMNVAVVLVLIFLGALFVGATPTIVNTLLGSDEEPAPATNGSSWSRTSDDPRVRSVAHLDTLTFPAWKQQLDGQPGVIMFYAPWCGHCTRTKPAFAEASAIAEEASPGKQLFAAVDCTEDAELCASMGVRGYPTIVRLRGDNGDIDDNRPGSRTVEALLDFLSLPDGAAPKRAEPVAETENGWADALHAVGALHASSNEEYEAAFKQTDCVLVLYYATWCGHCKRMKDAFIDAAAALRDVVPVLAANGDTVNAAETRGFPTLRAVRGDGTFVEYSGDRSTDDIQRFARSECAE